MMYNVQLVDLSGRVVATGRVSPEEGRFVGELDLRSSPPPLRQTFAEFEEIVNGQNFSLLDEIEARMRALSLRAVFEGYREAAAEDFQLYPSTGMVSFKLLPSAEVKTSAPA